MWLQMMLVLVIVVTVPIISLAVLLISTGHKAVEQSVYRDYKEIATRASKEIGLFVKSPSDTLATTAAIIGVSPNDISRQELLLRELSLNMPMFTHISSTDNQGIEIASSIVKKERDDFHGDPAFLKARDSEFYISEIRLTSDNIPYVIMSVPIIHLGENHGVLMAQVNMREMWNIVDGIRLGDTGHAFLMEQDKKIIAHPDKKRIFQYESFPGDLSVQVMSGAIGSMEYTDTLGASWVGSYASIPELKWELVVRQDTTEAYLFSQKMKSHFKNMVIIGELIAILFAILLSQLMTRPIMALITATKRISSGDLEHKIGSLRQDEIGKLSQSFDEMIDKLKRSRESDRLAVIGTLASSIAHEIKNPMVSISTFVQLLPERYNDPGFRDKFKTIVPQELDRINNILEELLTFVRPVTPKFARTDIKNIMDRVLVLVEGSFKKYGIKVVKRYTDNLPEPMADGAQLEQIFINIIMNAIHAMQDGGTLTIAASPNLQHLELRLEDTGCGIPPENLNRIFEAFFTTKADGTGLGLAICRKIIMEHGGTINVDSSVGIGTSFTVNIPLKSDKGKI
jgi:signal transduction histidine kinase